MFIGIVETCSDNGLANFLGIFQSIMTIFQIIVPIISIVALIKILTQLLANPEEKKLKNSIRNWAISLLVFFFLPFIIEVTINLFYYAGLDNYKDQFSFKACWDAAKNNVEINKGEYKNKIN